MNHLTIQHLPELPFEIEEAVNQLRVNLGFCGDQIKTVMITSSVPNEGKSFITMQLWRMMAEVGSRVLLIDCDLRKSEMRAKYGISSDEKITGIAHYLAGKVELPDAIYSTNVPNGFLMPLAASVANPSILLENPRFAEMVEVCAGQFDYVLIDTPPLESVADALRIATHADGVVLVVRSGRTSRKLVADAAEKLQRTGAPILGVVLSRAEMDRRGSRYYKRYYYNGYYSKGYGHKPGRPQTAVNTNNQIGR